jgi:4-diphosphocytidyl-2-C-methyl-D-erythritol kinase
VFAKLDARSGVDKLHWPEGFANAAEVIAFLKTVANDLEATALSVAPMIGDVLGALRSVDGVQLARMSGSGATCFGLFADRATAEKAATQIARDHSDWWMMPTTLSKADEP